MAWRAQLGLAPSVGRGVAARRAAAPQPAPVASPAFMLLCVCVCVCRLSPCLTLVWRPRIITVSVAAGRGQRQQGGGASSSLGRCQAGLRAWPGAAANRMRRPAPPHGVPAPPCSPSCRQRQVHQAAVSGCRSQSGSSRWRAPFTSPQTLILPTHNPTAPYPAPPHHHHNRTHTYTHTPPPAGIWAWSLTSSLTASSTRC